MIESDSPHALLGAAAAAAATALTPLAPAHAAAPPSASRTPASTATRSARIEVTVVTDGANTFTLPGQLRRQQEARRGERGARPRSTWKRT